MKYLLPIFPIYKATLVRAKHAVLWHLHKTYITSRGLAVLYIEAAVVAALGLTYCSETLLVWAKVYTDVSWHAEL